MVIERELARKWIGVTISQEQTQLGREAPSLTADLPQNSIRTPKGLDWNVRSCTPRNCYWKVP